VIYAEELGKDISKKIKLANEKYKKRIKLRMGCSEQLGIKRK
jgi:hypothetical protein